jgi:large subunit ribosomal protein L19
MKHGGIQQTFTVRRVVNGRGVERVFVVHSPNIAKIEVLRKSRVKRSAKMYYMRGRIGKRASEVDEIKEFNKN